MNKKSTWKWVVLLLVVVAIILTIWFAIFKDFGRFYHEDIVIKSPDGNHQLLIREWGTIGGTGAEIYAITPGLPMWLNQLMKTEIGQTYADDSCFPFSKGNYELFWDDSYVVIYYISGRSSEDLNDISTWRSTICILP